MTGFNSKRAAAADKLDSDDLTIAYMSGYHDGKRAAQLEQLTEKEKISREMTAEIAAARALAQPAQEPVGMVKELFTQTAWEKLDLRGNTKVYITPPQREPLTDEAVLDIADYCLCDGGKTYGVLDFARAIEAAHGIKE